MDTSYAENRYAEAAQVAYQREIDLAHEAMRPFALFKPRLFQDGDMWCCLLGSNIQEGVCGFGPSPHDATIAFDKAWYEKTKPLKEAP